MKVWILGNPNGSFRGKFHRQDASNCPGRRRGEEDRDDYVLVDLAEVPDRQKACQFGTCFEGHGSDAAEVTGRAAGREAVTRVESSISTSGAKRKEPARTDGKGIGIGQRVEFRDLASQKKDSRILVAGRASTGELSAQAPIGKAMLGSQIGEIIRINPPGGLERRVEILGARGGMTQERILGDSSKGEVLTFGYGDDAAYEEHVSSRRGYVLVDRGGGSFMLHISECSHLQLTAGSFALDRPRRWSNRRQALTEWTIDETGVGPIQCQSCT